MDRLARLPGAENEVPLIAVSGNGVTGTVSAAATLSPDELITAW